MIKIRKSYRIREDICRELEALVMLSNRNLKKGDTVMTEVYIVEDAIVMYLNWVKNKSKDLGKE